MLQMNKVLGQCVSFSPRSSAALTRVPVADISTKPNEPDVYHCFMGCHLSFATELPSGIIKKCIIGGQEIMQRRQQNSLRGS
jgi:hypothetical protein